MTTRVVSMDRSAWLGHRWQRHGLDGECGAGQLDDLLLLGMQGSQRSGGEHALSQRTSRIGRIGLAKAIRPEGPLVTMWSVRGAPHAHRATQLDIVRDALAPQKSDDGGPEYINAVAEVASALQQVVTGATPKGHASAEVAGLVSSSLIQWCARCESDHVPDGMFRAAGRQARLVISQTKGRTTVLHPPPKVPQNTVSHPRLAVLQAYFRVNGPTNWTLFRDWMAAGTPATKQLWEEMPEPLVRVTVDTQRYDLPESLVGAVREAPSAKGVALVPPNDPYLRQVDRTLLVPDPAQRRQVYRALSAPGALIVDGEVAGTWRYRRSDHEVRVEPFGGLTPTQEEAIEQRAHSLAASTGDETPAVIVLRS